MRGVCADHTFRGERIEKKKVRQDTDFFVLYRNKKRCEDEEKDEEEDEGKERREKAARR